MEAKRSIGGTKRFPRDIKWQTVEKREEENWTWKQAQAWVKKTYNIDVKENTMRTWRLWYNMKLQGFDGHSSAENHNAAKRWDTIEDKELKFGVKLGLTNQQIVECMNEDENLNNRVYTMRSIVHRKQRLGLSKTQDRPKAVERAKNFLPKDQELIQYINNNRIEVKCVECGHIKITGLNNILANNGCPMCIQTPYSYQEVYVIEFPSFGNPSVKVGISSDYLEKRKYNFPEHTTVAVYKTTFKEAREIEILITEIFGEYRTTPPELHKNGSTECYDISITNKINKTIKEQLYG